MSLDQHIEGVLFYKATAVKKKVLLKLLNVSTEELDTACLVLQDRLNTGGTRLTMTDTELQLVAAPELSILIDSIRKEELKKDIGKAGAETLAIILYKGPVSRADIDGVRGVNSSFIIRNLLVRGLIEKCTNPTNKQSFTYRVTPMLLNHLGVAKKEDLSEFSTIMDSLDTYEKERAKESDEENIFDRQT